MIKFLDLHKINQRFESEFINKFQQFLDSGRYILGSEVASFEKEFADFCGTEYCVGTANGLDALTLIFKSYIELGILSFGDEVIVPANTYIASIISVLAAGLKPVFVEPDETTFNLAASGIEQGLTNKTKAVLVVHLYGQLTPMKDIQSLTKTKGLLLIEDAAQAHGAVNEIGVKAGNLSDAAGFSFYPSKNLGALGDGGAITTNNKDLFNVMKMMRNYGASSKYVNDYLGINSRLDEVQAAFLRLKLQQLDDDNQVRREIAKRYLTEIKNTRVDLPTYDGSNNHVFHAFVIRTANRDALMAHLDSHEVQYLIHYPIPPHKQQAFKQFNKLNLPITEHIHATVLTLPLSPVMTQNEVTKVINTLNAY